MASKLVEASFSKALRLQASPMARLAIGADRNLQEQHVALEEHDAAQLQPSVRSLALFSWWVCYGHPLSDAYEDQHVHVAPQLYAAVLP